MLYKGIKYSCDQVEKYGGKIVTVYSCSDKDLLKEYTTTYFEAFTKHRMHEKIDHFIDNAQYQETIRASKEQAVQEFYASMGENKGD